MRWPLARTVLAWAGFLIFLLCALPQPANGTFVAPMRNAPFTAVSTLDTTRLEFTTYVALVERFISEVHEIWRMEDDEK